MESVVSELEGTLLKDLDTFSYFMLIAFEASGLIRFALLLASWPLVRLLELCGRGDYGLKITIFVATAGVPISEIEAVARAVLPKFYLDDIDMEAWRVFSSYEKRVVATKMPRVMVERFVKEHLKADGVVGNELYVNRFGFATGFVGGDDFGSFRRRMAELFGGEKPSLGLGRPDSACGSSFLPFCHEVCHPPFTNNKKQESLTTGPVPVIFHDGRLAIRPTQSAALVILLWIPLGCLLAIIRITLGIITLGHTPCYGL
ncbi:glycerol-3-phosphate acyltransferase 5-like [Henckelia pumila]|uniref:glycerol-3-phosphate acyltransferase 5-like n=1 Tax=Henckelia pumila TaxID=405737 RepID=UPI003C6E549A